MTSQLIFLNFDFVIMNFNTRQDLDLGGSGFSKPPLAPPLVTYVLCVRGLEFISWTDYKPYTVFQEYFPASSTSIRKIQQMCCLGNTTSINAERQTKMLEY